MFWKTLFTIQAWAKMYCQQQGQLFWLLNCNNQLSSIKPMLCKTRHLIFHLLLGSNKLHSCYSCKILMYSNLSDPWVINITIWCAAAVYKVNTRYNNTEVYGSNAAQQKFNTYVFVWVCGQLSELTSPWCNVLHGIWH